MIPLYSNQFVLVPPYTMLTTTHPLFLSLCERERKRGDPYEIPYNPSTPPHVSDPSFPFLREKEKGGDICEIPFILLIPSGPAAINNV